MRVLVVLAALLVVSCSRPSPPTLTPQRAEVTAVGTSGISLLVAIAVNNPNRFSLSARQVTAEVTLDGRFKLGAVTVPQAIDMPANQSTGIDVPVSVAWTDLPSIIALAATGRSIPYAVDGTVNIGGDVIHVELPYHLTGEITREQLGAALRSSVPENWLR
jgi:LEA14-like dessication related protein